MPDQLALVLASLSEAAEDGEGGQRNLLVFFFVNEPKGLTVDELALLPLSGVPAYHAVRTLTHTTCALVKPNVAARRPRRNGRSPDVISDTDENVVCVPLNITTRPRILILRGHDLFCLKLISQACMSKVKIFKIHSCRKTYRQILRFNEMFCRAGTVGFTDAKRMA